MPNCIPDENILQSYPASCAIKCQQIILRDYGIDVSEADLCRIAKENGWYDENVGVYMHDNGKLLGSFNVAYHHSQNNGLNDIKKEISLGHRVMVNVNLAKLHAKRDKNNESSHALLVNNVDDSFIYLTNPANGIFNERHSRDFFDKAWKDSCRYMLATDTKAYFAYDPLSHMMIEEK